MARSSETHELSMPPSDLDDVVACEDKSGGQRSTRPMWKPYLTVVEGAIMSWSMQFVVKHERSILQSQQTREKIVKSQPIVAQSGTWSRYSISARSKVGNKGPICNPLEATVDTYMSGGFC